MSDLFTETLLDSSRVGGLISGETRTLMSDMLDFGDPEPAEPLPAPIILECTPAGTQPGLTSGIGGAGNTSVAPSTHLASVLPSLAPLLGRILEELEKHPGRLLSLNPSRRDSIAKHLERLSGYAAPATPNGPTHGPIGAQSNSMELNPLRRFIEGSRSSSQNSALRSYFEEVALMTLGQAILLKAWSDRGIRRWSSSDLGRLNWALNTTLRPQVPLDREGWQITRPNLYSWYNPSELLQHEMWNVLDSWNLSEEGPAFLSTFFNTIRKSPAEVPEPVGYDSRFYDALWDQLGLLGFDPQPEKGLLKRNKIAFSPTLRDGTLVQRAPNALQWVGLEASPLYFMMAELMQLWWRPIPPPFWSIGTGLEVHTRDQLSLALASTKPSVICRIAEMEACDVAVVLEEQIVRSHGRNPTSQKFKETVDKLPYFKRLKTAGTSLGDLQACVALNKLRPNGYLLWAREEALSSKDGREVLNFILDRSKLLCEWDFSELGHSLPAAHPLFPGHLYLFQKETHLETRLSHRPVRHSIHGQLRSHVELSLVLEDALQSAVKPVQSRGQWKILSYVSPNSQRDWAEKWPDPASHSVIRHLDRLRGASLPLANFTTIRQTPASPEGDPTQKNTWSVQVPLRGFWLTGDHLQEGRKLNLRSLPAPGQICHGSGLMVLVPEESWVAPLKTYLGSELVHQWLDQNAERRGDRWILNEQVVKWIPVPKTLLSALGVPTAHPNPNNPNSTEDRETPPTAPLPSQWEQILSASTYRAREIQELLEKYTQNSEAEFRGGESDPHFLQIHTAVFLKAARMLDYLRSGHNATASLVSPQGQIQWGPLLDLLPKAECVGLSVHPRIRITGTLPPHLPIHRIERVKSPSSGILLATESGFSLHLGCESHLLMNILWDQLSNLTHPTWSELTQFLRLPRKVELAESTAMDVLNSHAEQSVQVRELQDLLNSCQLF